MNIVNSDTGEHLTNTDSIVDTDTPTLGLRYLELKAARSALYKATNAVEDTIMDRMRQGGATAILEGGVEINIKDGTPKYRVDELLPLKESHPEVYEQIVLPVPASLKVDGRKMRTWRSKIEAVDEIAATAQEAGTQTLEVKPQGG